MLVVTITPFHPQRRRTGRRRSIVMRQSPRLRRETRWDPSLTRPTNPLIRSTDVRARHRITQTKNTSVIRSTTDATDKRFNLTRHPTIRTDPQTKRRSKHRREGISVAKDDKIGRGQFRFNPPICVVQPLTCVSASKVKRLSHVRFSFPPRCRAAAKSVWITQGKTLGGLTRVTRIAGLFVTHTHSRQHANHRQLPTRGNETVLAIERHRGRVDLINRQQH